MIVPPSGADSSPDFVMTRSAVAVVALAFDAWATVEEGKYMNNAAANINEQRETRRRRETEDDFIRGLFLSIFRADLRVDDCRLK